MMDPLPFELDSPELLEAAMAALAALTPVPARERTVDPERFAEAGYDIDAEALKLQRFYLEKRL